MRFAKVVLCSASLGAIDLTVFRNLTEVCEHTERWPQDYNEEIPHIALDGLTLVEYRQFHSPETSSYAWT